MGFGFRKSKKIGGVRLNLSKSGLGISYGIKGFRISHNSRGTYLNAGRGGIYYRKKLNSSNCQNVNSNKDFSNQYEENNDTYSIIKIDSEYEYFVDKKEEWLLPELEKFYRNQIVPGCAGCFVFILGFICPFFWLINVFHLIYYFKKISKLEFKISPNSYIKKYAETMDKFSDNTIIYNANSLCEIQYGKGKLNPIIKSFVPYIKIEDYKLFFIETGILFYGLDNVFLVPYEEIDYISTNTTTWLMNPPKDSEILETSYEHVNKDGSPSKRYKINNKIYKINSWVLEIVSDNYISLPIVFFNKSSMEEFCKLIQGIKQNRDL